MVFSSTHPSRQLVPKELLQENEMIELVYGLAEFFVFVKRIRLDNMEEPGLGKPGYDVCKELKKKNLIISSSR